jgi:hypothetical protein
MQIAQATDEMVKNTVTQIVKTMLQRICTFSKNIPELAGFEPTPLQGVTPRMTVGLPPTLAAQAVQERSTYRIKTESQHKSAALARIGRNRSHVAAENGVTLHRPSVMQVMRRTSYCVNSQYSHVASTLQRNRAGASMVPG